MRVTLVLAAAVAMAGAVFWLLRDRDEAPALNSASATPEAASAAAPLLVIDEASGADTIASAKPAPTVEALETSNASSAAASSASRKSARPVGRVVLEGTLEGTLAPGETGTRGSTAYVEIALEGVECRGTQSFELQGRHEFNLDITRLFETRGCAATMLRVCAQGQYALRSLRRIDVSHVQHALALGQDVRLAVALLPLVRRELRGVAHCEDASVQARVSVYGGWRMHSSEDADWCCNTSTQSDGAFEVDTHSGGRVCLIAHAPGHLPVMREFDLPDRGAHDVGTLHLPRGVGLEGRVVPAIEGAYVRATCLDVPAEFRELARRWPTDFDGSSRNSLLHGREAIDVAGAFTFTGLVASSYRLQIVDVPGVGDLQPELSAFGAPTRGIEIHLNLSAVELTLRRRGKAIAGQHFEVARPNPRGGYFTRRALLTDVGGAASCWTVAGEPHELVVGDHVRTFLAPARGETLDLELDL